MARESSGPGEPLKSGSFYFAVPHWRKPQLESLVGAPPPQYARPPQQVARPEHPVHSVRCQHSRSSKTRTESFHRHRSGALRPLRQPEARRRLCSPRGDACERGMSWRLRASTRLAAGVKCVVDGAVAGRAGRQRQHLGGGRRDGRALLLPARRQLHRARDALPALCDRAAAGAPARARAPACGRHCDRHLPKARHDVDGADRAASAARGRPGGAQPRDAELAALQPARPRLGVGRARRRGAAAAEPERGGARRAAVAARLQDARAALAARRPRPRRHRAAGRRQADPGHARRCRRRRVRVPPPGGRGRAVGAGLAVRRLLGSLGFRVPRARRDGALPVRRHPTAPAAARAA